MDYCRACFGYDYPASDNDSDADSLLDHPPTDPDPLPPHSPTDKLIDVLAALNNAKLPSQEQTSRFLQYILKSDLLRDDAASGGWHKRHGGGLDKKTAKVVRDVREVVQALLQFGMEKNDDDKIQNIFYQLSQIDTTANPIAIDIDTSNTLDASKAALESGKARASHLRNQAPTQTELQKDFTALQASLKSLAYTLLTSSIFRVLLADALSIAREVVAHAAGDVERGAEAVRASAEGVEKVARGDAELESDDVKGKGREVVEGVLKSGREVREEWEEVGEKVRNEAREKLILRIRQLVIRASQDASSRKAISTILSLIRKYADKLSSISDILSNVDTANGTSYYPPHPYPSTNGALPTINLSIPAQSSPLTNAFRDFAELLQRMARGRELKPLLSAFGDVMRDLSEAEEQPQEKAREDEEPEPPSPAPAPAPEPAPTSSSKNKKKKKKKRGTASASSTSTSDVTKKTSTESMDAPPQPQPQPPKPAAPNLIRRYFTDIGLYLDRSLSDPGWAASSRGADALEKLVQAGLDLPGSVVVVVDNASAGSPNNANNQFSRDFQRLLNELSIFTTALCEDRTTSQLIRALEGLQGDIGELLLFDGGKARRKGSTILKSLSWTYWLPWVIPRVIRMIPPGWVPVPRVEVRSGSVEAALDALWVSRPALAGAGGGGVQGKLVPDEMVFSEWTEVRVDMADDEDDDDDDDSNEDTDTGTGVQTTSKIHLHLSGIRASVSGLGYFFRYGGENAWVGYEDEGVVSVDAGVGAGVGKGVGVDVELEVESSGGGGGDSSRDDSGDPSSSWYLGGSNASNLPAPYIIVEREQSQEQWDDESTAANDDVQKAIAESSESVATGLSAAAAAIAITSSSSSERAPPLFKVTSVQVALEGLKFTIDKSRHWILNKLFLAPLAGPVVSGFVKSAAEAKIREGLEWVAAGLGRLKVEAEERRRRRRMARREVGRWREMRRVDGRVSWEEREEEREEEDAFSVLLGDWWGALLESGPEAFGYTAKSASPEEEHEGWEEVEVEVDSSIHPTSKGVVYTSTTTTTTAPDGETEAPIEPPETLEIAIGTGPQLFPGKGGPYGERNDAIARGEEEAAAGERRRLVEAVEAGVDRVKTGFEEAAHSVDKGKEEVQKARVRKGVREGIEARRAGWRSGAFDLL